MSFTLAIILMAIFTLFSIPENSYAKTGVMFYGGKSVSPSGDLKDFRFESSAIGGGVVFGMKHRVAFGLDYMGQKAVGTKPGEYSGTLYTGQSFIGLASFYGLDISAFNVNPADKYVGLATSKSGKSGLAIGTLYVNLLPKADGSSWVEPVLGLSVGLNLFKDEVSSTAYYHPHLRELETAIYSPVWGESEDNHFKYDNYWDDGSGGARHSINRYKFVYGPSFRLNFYLPGNLVISPEARYLKNYGFIARTGIGFAF